MLGDCGWFVVAARRFRGEAGELVVLFRDASIMEGDMGEVGWVMRCLVRGDPDVLEPTVGLTGVIGRGAP